MDNLAHIILARAAANPDRTATQSSTASLTYRQLEEQATKAAHVLRNKGVGPADIVAIAFRDGQHTVVAMLGAWLQGATCIPIDTRLGASEKKAMCRKYGLALVLEDDSQADGGYPSLSLSQWNQELAAAPVLPLPAIESQGAAVFSLTSGTTGEPASMEIGHDAFIFSMVNLENVFPSQFYERYLSLAPLSFGGAPPWVFRTLKMGGTVIFFPTIYQPRDLIEAFETYRVTGCTMVPTVLRDLLRYLRENGIALATADTPLRLATHGGSIAPSELMAIRELITPHVLQVYATQSVRSVTYLDLDKELNKIDTVGRPLRGVEVEIVSQDGKPQPPMTPGIIRINSPGRANVLKGRDSKDGSDYFIGDWYYPGDLGLIDADGYLKLLGRTSEVIIRGGANVFPQEVEGALADIPGVKQLAAVGYPDERNGEEIALFATVEPGVSAEDLQKHCRDRLGPDKRPKRVVIIPQMPLNPNGKVQRKELLKMIS